MSRPRVFVLMMTDRIAPLADLPVHQLGIVVHDARTAARRYSAVFGIESWTVYVYSPATVPEMTFRGARASFAMKLAMSSGRPQIELIQPLAGPNSYSEWLTAHGEGLHHLAFVVPSLPEKTEEMIAAGYEVLQSGRGYGLDGDGAYVYMDTTAQIGIVVELVELPTRRRPPDECWRW